MNGRFRVNYVYFGIFFFFIAFVHIFQLFLIDHATFLHRSFYIIYALGQCLMETGVLLLLANYFAGRLFIVFTFLLLLIHAIDFPLIRIMDMTVWYAIDFVRAESYTNFIEMLRASNVSMTSWVIAGVAALTIPLIGIGFFYLTDRLSKKRPLYLSNSTAVFSLFSVLLFITIFDFKTYVFTPPATDTKFLKALPWKTTLFSIPNPHWKLRSPLAAKSSESNYLLELSQRQFLAQKKPNIFLFIAESIREDFITPQITPHLAQFQKECAYYKNAISGANATQFSWFSIFHSVYPLHWESRRPTAWKSGSPSLQILKKLGYKIHLFSSARLEYYQMNELLFGTDRSLADSYHVFAEDHEKKIYENDTACIDSLLDHLDESEGNLYLVFLDSTHFDYSWPEADSLVPAPDKIDYLSVACTLGIEDVKSRYINALHFIDSLMGRFFKKLETLEMGKEAVIVMTGDHGEEFLEQGNIFHASSLSSMQTRVPLLCRFGSKAPINQEMASHVDIFPSILHHLLGHADFSDWFDGESLLQPRQKNFVVSTRYNASRAPYEFLIHNGHQQLIARFDNPRQIFKSRNLHLVSLRDRFDRLIEINSAEVDHEFKAAFKTLFPE